MTLSDRTARILKVPLFVTALFALLVLSPAIAACGGDSAETTTTAVQSGSTTAPSEGSATTAGAGEIEVIMDNRSYDPATITIKVGDTVTWVNHEGVRHDVVADNGEFKSDLFDDGESFGFTFAAAGTYPYHCSIHPGMEGTVIVE